MYVPYLKTPVPKPISGMVVGRCAFKEGIHGPQGYVIASKIAWYFGPLYWAVIRVEFASWGKAVSKV